MMYFLFFLFPNPAIVCQKPNKRVVVVVNVISLVFHTPPVSNDVIDDDPVRN